jgi:predicted phage terminase large subunit-like protein
MAAPPAGPVPLDPIRGVAEAMLRRLAPPADTSPRWETPGDLAQDLDPRTVQTPALDLIDEELVRLSNTPDGRLIISLAPQEGKSSRVAEVFPVWALHQDPDLRIVVASYGMALARRNGRAIRNRIATNSQILHLNLADDLAAQHEWQLAGHTGGVYAAGVGTALTGRPCDLMIIDDPVKDRTEADSATYRQNVWDWWTDVASTRLAPGAPVVLILTRWHEDDLAGRLLAAEDGHLWRVVNIPAQADHDPAVGEADLLGREPGEFLESARRRTREQWEAIKVRAGSRTWNALYQGRPSPVEGGIFKREWWQEFTSPRWVLRPDGSYFVPGADEVVQSWDMAFKDTSSSDYVVGQVWGRWGLDVFLLDQVCERLSFVDTLKAVREMSARWPQAVAKYVEDKANGTAVINALSRTVPGLIPVEPDGSKEARASAVSPFVEAGSVYLPAPELAPWVGAFVEEHAGFPHAAHDDQVDATSQALNRLLLNPILSGGLIVDAEDFDDDLAPSISLY